MRRLFEFKGYLAKFYAEYSLYVDKALQFVLALLTFTFISQNIGFSEFAANPLMTVALSLICTFLPRTMTVVLATVATLMQFYTLSMGIALVAMILFLVMYAFYIRFTPERSIILLLVPIAFMLKIPMAIPIIFGLIGGPICILPITMGTIIYYMVRCVNSYATLLGTVGESGTAGQMTTYTQQLLTNREMWCTIISFAICLLLVYSLRRMSEDHAWEIAIVAGALANLITMSLGYIMMDVQVSYVSLIIGSIVAVALALALDFLVFSVDYSRKEYLQFEDDEYYYYVKAVPKVSVATPVKTVKRIHERQKTGVIDVEQVQALEQAQEMERMAREQEESEIQRIIEEELRQ